MTEALWTSSELSEATGGQASAPFSVTGISIDSRSLCPGDLFVALSDARDGHEFAEAAFAAGAAGALVSRPVEGGPFILVEDVLEGLTALGIAARERAPQCYRVAVTGSVGKTSVKEMIARIFRAAGRAHWSEKSFNNQWGVPLSLARMPRDTEYAVFEIGMSTPGEIAPRSDMVAPHAALVTKIAAAHLEGLGSVEAIADEKADIFSGLVPGGHVLLPQDSHFLDRLTARALSHQPDAAVATFGEGVVADLRVLNYESDGQSCEVGMDYRNAPLITRLEAVGAHWAMNAAAAILGACAGSGLAAAKVAEALDGYAPLPGRGTAESLDLPSGGAVTLIDDAYNANPESMRAALAGFAARPCRGRRILALGEMLEIGSQASAEHAGLADPVLATAPDLVVLAGQGMQPLAECLEERIRTIWEVKSEDLESHMKNILEDGDLLLLKGSNASGMGRLAERLRGWSEARSSDKKRDSAQSAVRGENAV